MDTIRPHSHSRTIFIGKGLMSESVIDQPVDTHTKGPVTLVFHFPWIFFPGFCTICSKGFSCNNRSSCYMSNRCCLDATECRIKTITIAPEFAHWDTVSYTH